MDYGNLIIIPFHAQGNVNMKIFLIDNRSNEVLVFGNQFQFVINQNILGT